MNCYSSQQNNKLSTVSPKVLANPKITRLMLTGNEFPYPVCICILLCTHATYMRVNIQNDIKTSKYTHHTHMHETTSSQLTLDRAAWSYRLILLLRLPFCVFRWTCFTDSGHRRRLTWAAAVWRRCRLRPSCWSASRSSTCRCTNWLYSIAHALALVFFFVCVRMQLLITAASLMNIFSICADSILSYTLSHLFFRLCPHAIVDNGDD